MIGAQPTMEIVAKQNMVTVMDHHRGRRLEQFEEDPMVVPRRIMEKWKPQRIEELPEAFCGEGIQLVSYVILLCDLISITLYLVRPFSLISTPFYRSVNRGIICRI